MISHLLFTISTRLESSSRCVFLLEMMKSFVNSSPIKVHHFNLLSRRCWLNDCHDVVPSTSDNINVFMDQKLSCMNVETSFRSENVQWLCHNTSQRSDINFKIWCGLAYWYTVGEKMQKAEDVQCAMHIKLTNCRED